MRFVSKEISVDKKLINHISEKYNLHKIVSYLIVSRGFANDLESFISEGELYDPYLLNDMQKSVECIKSHINEGNKIAVYGDYDVDGVCACSILYLYLKSIDADVHVFLPDRNKDGYGLNKASIDELADIGTKLLITVDCGISNADEVAYAMDKGIDVIVTDHHQCPEVIPECRGVVNPLLGEYPYKLLCGSGVALKLVYALGGQEEADKYVDLAAIATVSDLVLLTGENRWIVKKGLKSINSENRRVGISALWAGDATGNEITSGNIAFSIGPKINAAGRMGSARCAFELFICEDYSVAEDLAKKLKEANTERKNCEKDILNQAVESIESNGHIKSQKLITVCGRGWSKGVIGIVASRLVEKYCRPVIVFSEENGVCVGSGRSIPGIHLFNLLNRFGDEFIKYGGHEMAAGMSVEAAKLETLCNRLNSYVAGHFNESLFIPSVYYDFELNLEEATHKLAEDIQKLAPLGIGNKTPIFRIKGVELKSPRLIGQDKNHIKMNVTKNNCSIDAVAFSMGDRIGNIKPGCKYDLIASLEVNEWENRNYLQLQIKEFKLDVKSDSKNYVFSNGKRFFESLKAASVLAADSVDQKRIRQMWNWEIYLQRRLRKDVLGTAVYTSIPTCAYELMRFLADEDLYDNVEVCIAAPKNNSCVVLAPDWNEDELNYSRLVIFDYAPTDFVNRVLSKNPHIQIVICNNDFTENCIQKFLMGLDFERDRAKVYYSIINSICRASTDEDELISRFCAMGNETAFNGYFALDVFTELELLENEEGKVSPGHINEKKNLADSAVIKNMYGLKDKILKEVDMIKPPRNHKGKRK